VLAEQPRHRLDVAAVGLEVPDPLAEVVAVAPVEHGHLMAAGGQPLHDLTPHELQAANHQNSHRAMIRELELTLIDAGTDAGGAGD
jgi:hypothetical protein